MFMKHKFSALYLSSTNYFALSVQSLQPTQAIVRIIDKDGWFLFILKVKYKTASNIDVENRFTKKKLMFQKCE